MRMFKLCIMMFVSWVILGCNPEVAVPHEAVINSEGPPPITEGYYRPDADGDGWGDIHTPASYVFIEGWTEFYGDCDDSDPLTSPDGIEERNDNDDDCDGNIDENWMYMFITDATYGGVGDGTGLTGPNMATGPDGFCNSQKGSLPGKYKAWLSNHASTSPWHRFNKPTAEQKYILVDGSIVADSWDDLTDGTLNTPINLKADGTVYEGYVWTSVTTTGVFDQSLLHVMYQDGYCQSWTISDPSKYGHVGRSDVTDSTWTEGNIPIRCNTQLPVICVRQ